MNRILNYLGKNLVIHKSENFKFKFKFKFEFEGRRSFYFHSMSDGTLTCFTYFFKSSTTYLYTFPFACVGQLSLSSYFDKH